MGNCVYGVLIGWFGALVAMGDLKIKGHNSLIRFCAAALWVLFVELSKAELSGWIIDLAMLGAQVSDSNSLPEYF